MTEPQQEQRVLEETGDAKKRVPNPVATKGDLLSTSRNRDSVELAVTKDWCVSDHDLQEIEIWSSEN